MEERMKRLPRIVTAGGLALAVATAISIDVNGAKADEDRASNSQLSGQYAGTSSGGCLVSLNGFDGNNRPIDQTKAYSNMFTSDVVFTFDGHGRGNANFLTNVNIVVPGPNTPSVAIPNVGLVAGGGNFTYSVGKKNRVTVTLTDPVFKNLNGPSAGLSSTIDEVVLEGHFGPNGVTLTKTDGAVEMITPPTGSPFPRICGRSVVLLSDRQRF
jgi:hypothetical protein